MKVFDLMVALSKFPAGATVSVGVSSTLFVEADDVDCDEMEVFIRSSEDPEVSMDNGDTVYLSSLTNVDAAQ